MMIARALAAAALLWALLGTSAEARVRDDWYRRPPSPPPPPPRPLVLPGTLAAPRPAPQPAGLYLVTQNYAGNAVRRSGDVTTYTTNVRPVSQTTTYARVLETVATGQRSAFDGRAFNGRTTMTNGLVVSGTYYENYVRGAGGFVPVSVVFFQDDSERARRAARPAAPLVVAPARATGPVFVGFRPHPVSPPAAAARPAPAPVAVPIRVAPPPPPPPPPPPARAPDPPLAPLPAIRIGVDPTGGAALLTSLEVARGQRYALRVNVASLGAPVVLESWSFAGGANDAANAPGWHGASEPLAGQWLRLPAPGVPWRFSLRVRVRVIEPAARTFVSDGPIEVWVRAPAVVE